MAPYTHFFSTVGTYLQGQPTKSCYTTSKGFHGAAGYYQRKHERGLITNQPRLLTLPLEIRLMIYETLFCTRNIHCCANDTGFPSHLTVRSCSGPTRCPCALIPTPTINKLRPLIDCSYLAILKTCKQIHDEADTMFFNASTFVIHDTTSLLMLQYHPLARGLEEIRSLRISIDLDGPRNRLNCSSDRLMADWHWRHLWAPLATSFPGLQHLHVELHTADVVRLLNVLQAKDSAWLGAVERGSRGMGDRRKLETVTFELGLPEKLEIEDPAVALAVKKMEARLVKMFLPPKHGGSAFNGGDVVDVRRDSGYDWIDDQQKVQKTERAVN